MSGPGTESERLNAVARLLFAYVKSPSLKHIRDPNSVGRLATEIISALDQASSVWRKWDGPREEIVKAAAPCWVPLEALHAYLNSLPGPPLSKTDVAQRLRAIWEERFNHYPSEDVKEGCEALYRAEIEAGTEMPAILGAIQEFIETEEQRLREEREKQYLQFRIEERERQQQVFLSGADCSWVQFGASKDLYCRKNGRAFRIVQGKDKRWTLHRVKDTEDAGRVLGTYAARGDANTALKKIAYEPEPRW